MHATKESLEDIRSNMPYPIVMVHPDCGKEFLNTEVIVWADEHDIDVTRSRSYHKNNNGHIEQRNDHVARKWLGYERLDHKELLEPIIKFIYEIFNFF